MKKILFTTCSAMLPLVGMAHEGHGNNEGTILHYFTSYWHFLPVAVAIAGAFLLFKALRWRNNYR